MSFSKINFWIEGDISTTRIISRLLNDVVGQGNCEAKLVRSIDWKTIVGGVNIFCRVSDPAYHWLPAYLKQNGVPYAYYLDDNFWKITGSGDLARYYQSPSVVNSLDEFVRGADFVITHTQVMADFIVDRFPNVRCEILPVPFDVKLLEEIHKETSPAVRRFPVVGYAGGFKKAEFEFLETVLYRLNKARPEIRFEFIGGISDELRVLNNVQWFPGFADYAAFMAFKVSRGWSVGLAPLMESEFNSSKTNNKFREYAGCNIAGIYSKTSPYIECVRSEENGLLVPNDATAWVEAIQKIIDDAPLREKIQNEAYSFVDANYSHKVIAPAWHAVVESIPKLAELPRCGGIRFKYFKYYHMFGFSDAATKLDNSSLYSVIKVIVKKRSRALLRRLAARQLLVVSIVMLLGFSIFFLLRAYLL
ncbi:glycosyltransferase [Pseudomonas fluorescens]|jgi:glycosyltransferase involved in cell wall biosynthesis|nr:glycosyltransferase [Pseudomonas fluorescens]